MTSRGVRTGAWFRLCRLRHTPRRHNRLSWRLRLRLQLQFLRSKAMERADVWWASLLRTRFEDGAIEVSWDEFTRLFRAKFIPEHIQDKMEQEFPSLTRGSMMVLEYEARFSELSKYAPHIVVDERRKAKKFVMGLKPSLRSRLVAFDHRMLDEALSAACKKESEMEHYLEEKKASQKRSAPPFQRQDRKKATYQSPQHPVVASSQQVVAPQSHGVRPSDKKMCPHCGRAHGGTECWKLAGKCLKCGSSEHQIKDCPRLQHGVQRGALAPAVAAAAALVTGRLRRPRAQARVFALAREDAKQAENVTEGVKTWIWEDFVSLLGLAEESFSDKLIPLAILFQASNRGISSLPMSFRQELDGKLVAIKILSWQQHLVLLTPVGGNPFAAKFFRFYRMTVLIPVVCVTGVSTPEEDIVRNDSERKE
ncbi:hypothetical protein Taro_039056 [Colocasia esculenta]|uniref:CCHC-type domain-containing protein n=1 Tax=Colocasia esculenta TaxID=4460 RepID=A0A843WP15_COLES|nr:hypothetical protein [Colocasia esculenta]